MVSLEFNIDNDSTIQILIKQALLQAEMGCDIAPSDMMDGRIGAIRKALEKNDLNTKFYLCVKYASNFTFRQAVGSKKLLKLIKKHTRWFRNSKTQ